MKDPEHNILQRDLEALRADTNERFDRLEGMVVGLRGELVRFTTTLAAICREDSKSGRVTRWLARVFGEAK